MITSKQRSKLRALANQVPSLFQLGKGGVNEAFIAQIDDLLTKRELIKISVLETSPISAKEAAVQVSEATQSEIVQVIGRKFALYRQNLEAPQIVLK